MKTKQEIQEANEKAKEIEDRAKEEERAAELAFCNATQEESDEFEKIVRPAQERWRTFSAPYYEALRTKQLAIRKARDEAIAKLQANWGNCPECNTPYGRYNTWCNNTKCGINLLTETEKKGEKDDKKD